METKKNNEVTNFMYYIFNEWGLKESVRIFGENLGTHIYNKYQDNLPYIIYWYSELDSKCKQTIVDRANELYNK